MAIPTTTSCQKRPARCSWLSEIGNRLRRAGSGVDVVTAQDPSGSSDLRPCASGRASYVAQKGISCNIRFMSQPQLKSSPLNELCSALPSLPMRLREVGQFVAANDYDATTRSMRDLAAAAGADPASFTRLANALGYSVLFGLPAALPDSFLPAHPSPLSGRSNPPRHAPNSDVSLVADKLEA